MKKGFSHIFRSGIISVLMVGFLAHLVLPFSSHAQKASFTQWLDHNVVSSGDENELKLRDTIRKLPERSGDFWLLVQEASELVTSNKDEFRLLSAFPDQTENQITSWLVGQWNVFQDQQNGTNAILPDATQSVQKWISPNSSPKPFFSADDDRKPIKIQGISTVYAAADHAHTLTPLESGISINAP